MNEAGLNAKWLRADLTHAETQKFTKDVLNHMRERLSDYQEQYGAISTIWRLHLQRVQHTDWRNMTEQSGLILSQQDMREIRHIIRILPICQ